MKVAITTEMKKVLTVAEMPAVNKVIAAVKDDTSTAKECAELAARIASGTNNVKVIEASAEIAKSDRCWNNIGEGTADIDVWITFTAIIDDGFDGIIMGGAYLTDLWMATSNNNEEIRSHMYLRKFTETK